MAHKILVADDSVIIQKAITLTLSQKDYEVVVADNGEEAWEKAVREKPELIIADTNMPGLTGYELCDKIRNDPTLKGTPFILLVGTYETFDAERAKKVGATDHITKPFESQILIQKVTSLLEKKVQEPPPPEQEPSLPPEPQVMLEPIELEELEPLEPPAELEGEVSFVEEKPPLEPSLEKERMESEGGVPQEPTPLSPLDFSDLAPVIAEESPPSQPPPPKKDPWNLEEFEAYYEKRKTEEKPPKEIVSAREEETPLKTSFVSPFPKEEGELTPSTQEEISVEPVEPFLEIEHEIVPPPVPVAPEPVPKEEEPPEKKAPPPPEVEPVSFAEKGLPSAAQEQPSLASLEEKVRKMVEERVEELLSKILPSAIDSAIARAVEKSLKEILERWRR